MSDRRAVVLAWGIAVLLAWLAGGCRLPVEQPVRPTAPSTSRASIQIAPGLPEQGRDPSQWRALALVRAEGGALSEITPEVRAEGARVLDLSPKKASLEEGEAALFFIHLEQIAGSQPAFVTFGVKDIPGCAKSCALPVGVDLAQLPWERQRGEAGSPWEDTKALPAPGGQWSPIGLPNLWQDLGITWVRTRFTIPSAWEGLRLRLLLAAVDDRDVAFLNGREIGRTSGWDTRRLYDLPPDCVCWGQENELCIAVDNTNAGGGVYKAPIRIVAGEVGEEPNLFPLPALQKERDRAPAGETGPRLPFRRMTVRDGVLRYEDGREVVLWGVNYYPQSWNQYESLKKLGVEHRKSVDEDFEDFARMGIDIIRIHVFDTEISDGQGNLIANDRLDVLDYLVAQCNKRGICLMLTPIAWWGSPNARPDSFSQNTPKQAMTLWPDRWPAQVNYLRQFLGHKNPYTGHRLVDEPCLTLFEIINEPTYWTYGQVRTGDPGETHVKKEISDSAIAGVRAAWESLIPSKEWLTPGTYECFRYVTLRRYINTMIRAMRDAGARQPIAYSAFILRDSDTTQAVADSRCEAITLSAYPGGLKEITDDRNLLKEMNNAALDSRLAHKARLVYEFDAPGAIRRVSMYPAMARHWRNMGVQVACQFQYDARAVAHVNWDWTIHYLNLWHTPEKMVSFLIGGEVFRRLPRGAEFPTPPDDQVFPPGAVSFRHNAALLCAEDCYMQARPVAWRPIPPPACPKRVLSVGSCPYFDYEGTGVVDLRIEGRTANLRIYPDVERLQYALKGTVEKPLTQLCEREHPFRLRMAGWAEARAEREEKGGWAPVSGKAGEFIARPGTYRLTQ